jgi:flagellar biosynthetic protein FliR
MFEDLLLFYPYVVPFLLVLFRLAGVVAFVPFFSNSSIPGNVKVLLGLAIAFCVWNVVPEARSGAVAIPDTLPSLIIAVAGEMSIGLIIGMLLAGVFAGIQLGAHMVSQQMGLSMATMYDPTFEDQSTVIEQVAFWIAFIAFLTMGGHRQIIHAVVYSFKTVPIGSGGLAPDLMLHTVLGSLQSAFHAATRVAMPSLAAFFIATLTSGLMSRAMPQLNMMTVGMSINLILGFMMIMVGLTGWALVSTDSLHEMFRVIEQVLGAMGPLKG